MHIIQICVYISAGKLQENLKLCKPLYKNVFGSYNKKLFISRGLNKLLFQISCFICYADIYF